MALTKKIIFFGTEVDISRPEALPIAKKLDRHNIDNEIFSAEDILAEWGIECEDATPEETKDAEEEVRSIYEEAIEREQEIIFKKYVDKQESVAKARAPEEKNVNNAANSAGATKTKLWKNGLSLRNLVSCDTTWRCYKTRAGTPRSVFKRGDADLENGGMNRLTGFPMSHGHPLSPVRRFVDAREAIGSRGLVGLSEFGKLLRHTRWTPLSDHSLVMHAGVADLEKPTSFTVDLGEREGPAAVAAAIEELLAARDMKLGRAARGMAIRSADSFETITIVVQSATNRGPLAEALQIAEGLSRHFPGKTIRIVTSPFLSSTEYRLFEGYFPKGSFDSRKPVNIVDLWGQRFEIIDATRVSETIIGGKTFTGLNDLLSCSDITISYLFKGREYGIPSGGRVSITVSAADAYDKRGITFDSTGSRFDVQFPLGVRGPDEGIYTDQKMIDMRRNYLDMVSRNKLGDARQVRALYFAQGLENAGFENASKLAWLMMDSHVNPAYAQSDMDIGEFFDTVAKLHRKSFAAGKKPTVVYFSQAGHDRAYPPGANVIEPGKPFDISAMKGRVNIIQISLPLEMYKSWMALSGPPPAEQGGRIEFPAMVTGTNTLHDAINLRLFFVFSAMLTVQESVDAMAEMSCEYKARNLLSLEEFEVVNSYMMAVEMALRFPMAGFREQYRDFLIDLAENPDMRKALIRFSELLSEDADFQKNLAEKIPEFYAKAANLRGELDLALHQPRALRKAMAGGVKKVAYPVRSPEDVMEWLKGNSGRRWLETDEAVAAKAYISGKMPFKATLFGAGPTIGAGAGVYVLGDYTLRQIGWDEHEAPMARAALLIGGSGYAGEKIGGGISTGLGWSAPADKIKEITGSKASPGQFDRVVAESIEAAGAPEGSFLARTVRRTGSFAEGFGRAHLAAGAARKIVRAATDGEHPELEYAAGLTGAFGESFAATYARFLIAGDGASGGMKLVLGGGLKAFGWLGGAALATDLATGVSRDSYQSVRDFRAFERQKEYCDTNTDDPICNFAFVEGARELLFPSVAVLGVDARFSNQIENGDRDHAEQADLFIRTAIKKVMLAAIRTGADGETKIDALLALELIKELSDDKNFVNACQTAHFYQPGWDTNLGKFVSPDGKINLSPELIQSLDPFPRKNPQ